MVHNYAGDDQEIVAGTSMTVDSLSPFCLVGEKKDSSAADDDDDDSSSSSSKKSSSSGKKSPKTGMNDSWMLWLMAAGVFAGASVVAYNKKKG
jgi:LPXTG-motif cell wall-anchored protein